MLFHEWTEFVTYPLDSSRVRSRVERLDTRRAFRVDAAGDYPAAYSADSERGAIIPCSTVVRGGDVFECMEVDDLGRVIIWTQQKVWFLVREGYQGQVEKLRYLPRNPPISTPPV